MNSLFTTGMFAALSVIAAVVSAVAGLPQHARVVHVASVLVFVFLVLAITTVVVGHPGTEEEAEAEHFRGRQRNRGRVSAA